MPPHLNSNSNSKTAEMSQCNNHLQSTINMQTAVGVVVLSVAAAAVFWKIKPE